MRDFNWKDRKQIGGVADCIEQVWSATSGWSVMHLAPVQVWTIASQAIVTGPLFACHRLVWQMLVLITSATTPCRLVPDGWLDVD